MEDSMEDGREVINDPNYVMNAENNLEDAENINDPPDDKDEYSDTIVNPITTTEKSDTIKPEVIKFTRLPMARIKYIMKMDPDVNLASNDAVFLITKATEMFIDSITKECYSYTMKAKKKIVTKKDFDAVVDTVDCLSFLEGAMDF